MNTFPRQARTALLFLSSGALLLPKLGLAQDSEADVHGRNRSLVRTNHRALILADVRFGISNPTGDLASVTSSGPSLGAGVIIKLSSRLGLQARGTLHALERLGSNLLDTKGEGPQLDLWQIGAGPVFELTGPSTSPWHAGVRLQGGVAFVSAEAGDAFGLPAFEDVDPMAGVAAEAGYELIPGLEIFLEAGLVLIHGGNEDESYLRKETILTHLGGVRARF